MLPKQNTNLACPNKGMLINFNNFCNINELKNGEYNFNIKAMTDNAEKTQELLEQLLQKSDAFEKKLTRIDVNLNTRIRDIKTNLESHKLQNKHEIDNIKNTLDDVEKSQELISQKFEEQNIKINNLM